MFRNKISLILLKLIPVSFVLLHQPFPRPVSAGDRNELPAVLALGHPSSFFWNLSVQLNSLELYNWPGTANSWLIL